MVRYSFLVRLFHPLLHAGLIPALSLITLSALARTFGRIVKPICFAVFKLIDLFSSMSPRTALKDNWLNRFGDSIKRASRFLFEPTSRRRPALSGPPVHR
jgi:hypothetical protein